MDGAGANGGATQARPAARAAVPFVTLDREHATVAGELRDAFEDVVRRSTFVLGDEVERFEQSWAAACGTAHCVGVASGTAALTLLLRGIGVGPGDEVLVPAHTFVASAFAVLAAGAVPVLCDVEDGTALLDPAAAAAAVTPRTAAVLAVHLYGQLCDMGALSRLASERSLALVEDAAQAHGATWQDRPAGGFGAGAAFSFYPSKNLGALGDGGAVCTDDAAVADRVRLLRDLGRRGRHEHVVAGVNERLDGIQAAFLTVKLARLREGNEARRRHAARYRAALEGCVRLVEERPHAPSVHHVFPIRVPDRDAVARRLGEAGIGVGVHYPLPLHRQPALEDAALVADALPRAEAWAAEELSLPMSPALRADEVDRAAAAVAAALPEAGGG